MSRPFSQRYGYVKVEEVLQIGRIDNNTRTALWSCLYTHLLNDDYFDKVTEKLSSKFWTEFLYQPADEEPMFSVPSSYFKGIKDHMKDFFKQAKWYEIFDFIECIIEREWSMGERFNKVFKRMLVGYSIINGRISPIVSDEEVQSIELATKVGTISSRSHFERALFLMSDREQPDYRNSIKESISAIESLCRKITDNEKGTLGQMIKLVEEKSFIHPSMKGAFTQLYGYTSDQSGIRHALTDDSEEPTLEEARYMLVICSAFSNYLVSKMSD